MQNQERIQQMKEKAESVKAVVAKIKAIEDALQYTVDLTKKQGGNTVAAASLDTEALSLLKKQCESAGLTLLEFPLRRHVNEIHTSLTLVDWGIAETGTLALNSTSEDVRIATMLAETHVAVLPASKIIPDSAAFEDKLNAILKKDASSYFAFITGASRTADIERVLAIGVHGPQELHILIIEENKA